MTAPGPLYLQSHLWAAIFWGSFAAMIAHEAWVMSRDRRKVAGQKRDGGSFWVIVVLQNAGFVACFAIPWLTTSGRIPLRGELLFPIAMAVFWAGWLLRFWSVLTLGRYFRTTVVVQDDHRLITKGPYRVVRNPSYSGALLMFLGLGLAQGDAWSAAAIVGTGILAYGWRIRMEEQALGARFGQAFDAYAERTWAVIPFVW
jgi:protein-S-isoprenylcysteine O-methyltransferase